MPVTFFSGNFAQCLAAGIKLSVNATIWSGNIDPSTAGFKATEGDAYLSTSTFNFYIKTGPSDIDWSRSSTLLSFSSGSVPFADGSGNLTEDNVNFFYNALTSTLEVSFLTINSMSGSIITTTSVGTSIEQLDDSLSNIDQTGFFSWAGAGPFWSTSFPTFTLLQGGTGYINGKKITWAANQSVSVVPAHVTYLIYIDNAGHIGFITEDDYVSNHPSDQIPLFLVLNDGTELVVVKENHEYSFEAAVTQFFHINLGTIIQNGGANITRITSGSGSVITDRELSIVGNDALSDSNLITNIPDSGGSAINWLIYYTNGIGSWTQYLSTANFPMFYNNAGTPTALNSSSTSSVGVYTLYVGKDNINNSSPTYIAVMDDVSYPDTATATSAISAGNTDKATNELNDLQLAQLGFIVVQNNGSGGFISDTIIAKSVFNSAIAAGGTTNQASLVTVQTGTFVNFFTPADNNVQNALNDLDARTVSINTPSTIVLRDVNGNFSVNTVYGNLIGNSTTSSSTSNVNVTNVSTNASFFPLFVASSATGVQPVDLGAGLTFNPSTNNLSTTTFTGHLVGNADTATLAVTSTSANNVNITQVSTNSTFFPTFVASSTTGVQAVDVGTGLTFNPSTNNLSTTTFTGALVGNATTATSATTAGTATVGNTVPTHSTSANSTFFPLFVGVSADSNQSVDLSPSLTFNASTSTLTTTTFVGALTGNATSATSSTSSTNATNATNVATTQTSTNASFFPLFVSSSTNSNQPVDLGTGLTFNPSTNNLSTTTFTGALSGNATTATSATTATTATNANNVATTSTSSNSTFYPLFVASSTNSNQPVNLNASFTFNASTSTITATTFNGTATGNLVLNTGDINPTSFSAANNQSSPANVTGLSFNTASVTGFKAIVTVAITATANLYATYTLDGIYKAGSSAWEMSQTFVGDTTNVVFSITSAGQIQYTSGNSAGFVSDIMKFRAFAL